MITIMITITKEGGGKENREWTQINANKAERAYERLGRTWPRHSLGEMPVMCRNCRAK